MINVTLRALGGIRKIKHLSLIIHNKSNEEQIRRITIHNKLNFKSQ